ncbi:NAD(P)H-dependent flavin oxidoreductase [Ornithinibacillus halophilus]|uniref:Probable nitronate monooxygenase n=1 Tax=Ornithinibacillus halophilus TaxID=930117 RepID=A0A1M5KFL4_9BACI|nr:nitronate monooxygenase [Ornithinibacillus halophilus]SHG51527.1 nitronate monooxygenase [Ornithinibacillus halophilus]
MTTTESWKTLKDQVTLPVIVAPMFLISNPKMVVKSCELGMIGSFPTLNARTADILDEWFGTIKQELQALKDAHPDKKIAPWAVNFIAHRAHNKRYEEDLELIRKHQPPIVITSLGDPSPVAKIVHEYGGFVFSDVIDVKFAKKAIEKGSDGLILVAGGAGGHGGTYHPFAFVHEVKEFWDGPIILSGSISRGEDILAANAVGADFAYMGTRFLAAEESMAQNEYKEMVASSTVKDIFYTPAFSGVHANYLIPSIQNAGLDLKQLPQNGKLSDPDIKAWRDIWSAGHGVGSVKKIQSLTEIYEELKGQYEAAKAKIK